MGRHSKYSRHYKSDWEKEDWAKGNAMNTDFKKKSNIFYVSGWLREFKTLSCHDGEDNNEAYCLYCRSSLRAHYTDLKKHFATRQHKLNAASRIIPSKQKIDKFCE